MVGRARAEALCSGGEVEVLHGGEDGRALQEVGGELIAIRDEQHRGALAGVVVSVSPAGNAPLACSGLGTAALELITIQPEAQLVVSQLGGAPAPSSSRARAKHKLVGVIVTRCCSRSCRVSLMVMPMEAGLMQSSSDRTFCEQTWRR